MTLVIHPGPLSGTVAPPPSKSQAHRLLIAAALAKGDSLIKGLAHSKDIDATLSCLAELGASFQETAGGMVVHGMGANSMSPRRRLALPRLDCGESGSTLRLLIPVALAVRGGGIFTGHGRLMERPQGPYADLFREKGIYFEQEGDTLTVQGVLEPGTYRLPGNVSSQFFTGLLYALPLLAGPSALIPTTRLESWDYVAMTLAALEAFGIRTAATMSLPPQYHISGRQTYRAGEHTVEGDWSQAAFWLAAKALGGRVEVLGMDPNSLQGDRVIREYYVNLIKPGDVELDVSGCPDLVPALAAMAALGQGETRLVNAGRLRLKECDRLSAVAEELGRLGADITEGPDFLTIRGVDRLEGGVTADAHNDHRIAMMVAIAATRCKNPVTLTGAESVSKSYPNFWEDYMNLGGSVGEL